LCRGYLTVGDVFKSLSGSFGGGENDFLAWSFQVYFTCIGTLTKRYKVFVRCMYDSAAVMALTDYCIVLNVSLSIDL
jgi:hypothetical protein